MIKKQGLIDNISEKLCNEFQLAVPLHPDKLKRGKKLSEQDITTSSEVALKKFYLLADQERLSHGLGVIGRARVAFGLQQRLLNAGYGAPLVKQVLLAMLASVFIGSRRL
jgi:hypothetical protein